MSEQDTLPRSDSNLIGALGPYLRKDWWLYGLAILAAPGSAVLTVAQPWLLSRAIDEAIVPGDLDALWELGVLYTVAVVLAFVLEAAYTLSISYGAMRTITRLRNEVYRHTLSLARSFFDQQPTGRLLTRVTSDVDALGETLTAGAITIFLDVLLVTGVLSAMLWMNWRLTAVLGLIAPILVVLLNVIRKVLRRLYQKVRTSLATLNAFTAERIEGMHIVQLYSDEERTLAAYDDRLFAYRDATIRTNIWDALMYAAVDGLSSVSMALMLWYGSSGLIEDVVTAGLLAAFIEYVGKLFRPIQEFSAKLAVIQRAVSALEKIFGLLDITEQLSSGSERPEAGPVALRGVSFAYGDGPDVLRDVDLDIRPGEVVALVGRTGFGKTTIGKLLTGAYQGWRGSVTLNDVRLEDVALDHLRRVVGTVPQDVQLFPGTVRFNLTLGRPLEDDVLAEAIDLVRAGPTVERLGGLDGLIEQSGKNVSVGEAQLLSFARTMAHDPPIVILDEATASVDSVTEARIQEATSAILARKTVLVIAHRLSTIVGSDRICVMDAGRIVERGSHAELMEQDGVYASLFRQQFEAQGSGTVAS